MASNPSLLRGAGRLLEKVTGQSGRRQRAPEYGTRLLGRVEESQARRRVRIQFILTVAILVANLIGISVALLLVTVAFPVPSVFTDAPVWLTFVVVPASILGALLVGTIWITRRMVRSLRWAIDERPPTATDQRNTFVAPRRVATMHLLRWEGGAVLLTALYGTVDARFIPHYVFAFGLGGVMISAYVYLITEFALHPIAAQALEAGHPSDRFRAGIMGRTVGVCYSVPVCRYSVFSCTRYWPIRYGSSLNANSPVR